MSWSFYAWCPVLGKSFKNGGSWTSWRRSSLGIARLGSMPLVGGNVHPGLRVAAIFMCHFFLGAPCKRLSPQVEQSILMGRLLAALHQPICWDLWPECHRWRTLLRSTYVQYDTGATELRVHAPTLYTCHACLLGSTRCWVTLRQSFECHWIQSLAQGRWFEEAEHQQYRWKLARRDPQLISGHFFNKVVECTLRQLSKHPEQWKVLGHRRVSSVLQMSG